MVVPTPQHCTYPLLAASKHYTKLRVTRDRACILLSRSACIAYDALLPRGAPGRRMPTHAHYLGSMLCSLPRLPYHQLFAFIIISFAKASNFTN